MGMERWYIMMVEFMMDNGLKENLTIKQRLEISL